MTLREHKPELEDVVKNSIRAIGLLVLLTGAVPAIAQTATYPAPYLQRSALPPGAGSTASPMDSNAPRWMLLEGYGGDGHLYQHWQLVRPQDSTPPTTTVFIPLPNDSRVPATPAAIKE